MNLAPMLEIALKPYKVIGKQGETVLILGDTKTDSVVLECFATAAKLQGMNAVVLIMDELERDYSDPPLLVQKTAENADLLHYVTSTGIVHSKFGRRMSKMGKKKIVSEGVTREMLLRGSALADFEKVREVSRRVNEVWAKGKKVHVTTKFGTDLTLSIDGRNPYWIGNFPVSGFEIGTVPCVQFPGGEASVAPIEDSAEGVLVVDKSIHYPPGLLTEPIKLIIKQGTIVDISGGHEAYQFEQWLKSYGDEDGFRLCELAAGTNENAAWMGNPRQDRFVLGSCHIGFGMNLDVGGTIDSVIHYDAIQSCPTITVDSQILIENGRIRV